MATPKASPPPRASALLAHPARAHEALESDPAERKRRGIRPIQRLLAANRSEIAIRVFRACTEMGIGTVGIYSQEDKLALHRYKCDEAYRVGAGQGPLAAYLGLDEIVQLALDKRVDAIHPGYGFLSENAEFAEKVLRAGLRWVGPPPEVMRQVADKAGARRLARKLGLPVIPGTDGPVANIREALAFAHRCGYPVMVKACHGGGGRGIRLARNDAELREFLPLARREALAAFGHGECYVEKCLLAPKHLEVQILGDCAGRIVHLFERDCSIQRRHQKVIEFAPSLALDERRRAELCAMAVRFAQAAGYQNAGTVEFLMDRDGALFLIEMNARIQVEHTVTETITGIDLVQAQIRLAEGYRLDDSAVRVPPQAQIAHRGYAIQCRITTENPAKNFMPDYGRIGTYRSPAGFGLRLDGGTAFTGALITPYYDSLLVKVTSTGSDFVEASARMFRALSEFRIRGVNTNIPFLLNVLRHRDFMAGRCDTGFLEANPVLFSWREPRDRANKLLHFLAEVTVNGNPIVGQDVAAPPGVQTPAPPRCESGPAQGAEAPGRDGEPPRAREAVFPAGTKQILERRGPAGLARWVLAQKRLLVTDTTFRDAHQSLLATRMRGYEMRAVADFYARRASGLFSLEMWGGATFDAALRFLKEDPWQRLADLRARIPNLLLQMLVRGSSAVGYTNYPDGVVRAFIREAARTGIDIFRIFDSLNWLPGMQVAMDAALESGAVCEAAICYTGDLNDPARSKYGLKYYVTLARELERRGAHMLAIKDMAGLCKPYAVKRLVRALREAVGIPIHFHTHDTSGAQAATILKATEAGVHIADLAMASMSGLTSQPNLNALVAILRDHPRDTGLDLEALNRIADYFEVVRKFYAPFESDLRAGTAEVWFHEMPGGQYTNLRQQAEALGLGTRWEEVKRQYRAVNFLFGDIVKVTPSSKIVGDMALFLVSNRLQAADVWTKGRHLSFPESVIQFFEGHIGRPPGGFDRKLQKLILKRRRPLRRRPGALLKPVDLEKLREQLAKKHGPETTSRDALSAALYEKVFDEFAAARRMYGNLAPIPTKNFLYGMELDEEILVEIEPGKTLIVKLLAASPPAKDGTRKVYFELNGMPREASVKDKRVQATVRERPKAAPGNLHHLGAAMPGSVAEVKVGKGSEVKRGDVLLVLEAMKMQVHVTAPENGVVAELPVQKGDSVDAGDLLVVFA